MSKSNFPGSCSGTTHAQRGSSGAQGSNLLSLPGKPFKVKKDCYIKDGKSYDRVTTVLNYFKDPGLFDWAVRVGKKESSRKSKAGKSVGTRVHNLAHAKFLCKPCRVSPKESVSIKNCMEAYERWLNVEKPQILDMEVTEFHEVFGIAGTRDMRVAGNQLNDIKTSERISHSFWIQLAIYAKMCPHEIEKLGVVRLDKFTGEYEYKVIQYDERLVNLFLGLLSYYRYVKGYENRKLEVENGNQVAVGEIGNQFVIPRPEVRDDWAKWHREI